MDLNLLALILVGALGVGIILGILVYIGGRVGIKSARQKADAIIRAGTVNEKDRINKIIDQIESSNKIASTVLPEEDRVRIEKLREIRDA